MGDKGTLAPGGSQQPRGHSHQQQEERGALPLAVSWTPLDMAGTPTPGGWDISSAQLSVCPTAAHPTGCPKEGPRKHGTHCQAHFGAAGGVQCCRWGQDGEQGDGVPRKGVAGGSALGTSQLAAFLESMTFSKGPASMEALCGAHGDIAVPCWELMGMGSGSALDLAGRRLAA